MSQPGDSSPRFERRVSERLEVLGDLHGEVMVYQAMTIREISYSGLQIETSYPLHIDSLHELRLELGGSAVIVKGRVVHCSVTEMDREQVIYRSGFEFVQPSSGIRGVIADFIDAMRAGREPRGST